MNNTLHTTTVSGQTLPLDPPIPPKKPDMLLWIDTETTGIDRDTSKLLEVGMIVTSMDGTEAHDQFIRPVRPDNLDLYELSSTALRMHLNNGLFELLIESDPDLTCYKTVAYDINEWLWDEAAQYTLHPAGTNVDFDIDILTNQFAPLIEPDWLRNIIHHRKLDLSTFRLASTALGGTPYEGHNGTHRVTDCITRDRNDYAVYLDLMRQGLDS